MEVAFGVVAVALVILVFRLIAGSMDTERIEEYVRGRGWKLEDRSWDPFGPGWFGEKDSRIYRIVYRDQHGDLHMAHTKTSMLSGVYLTNDEIIERAEESSPGSPADPQETQESLREEVERLRDRVQELERGE